MRKHYNHSLKALKHETLDMWKLVSHSINNSIQAFKEMDIEAAKEIIAKDEIINELQTRIEDKAILLIATENPVAIDLRKTIAIIKIISNLERIGDHSVHLAKATIRLSKKDYIEPVFESIPEMGEIGLKMINDSMKAYKELDKDLAIKVARQDDEIDIFHKKTFNKIIDYMKINPEIIPQTANLLFIIQFLERLGDHVTNICEWIVYTITAEHVELND